SLFDFEAALAACELPTLLEVGDEDDPYQETNLFLKRIMKSSQLWVVPGTGHAVNLEEPDAFNANVQSFLSAVDRGCWRARDPRTTGGGALPGAKSKTG